MTFPGFSEESNAQVSLPEALFHQLLLEIDDLDELKVTLYALWRLESMEGSFRYLRESEMLKDERLVQALGATPRKAREKLETALGKAAQRGSLLQAEITLAHGTDRVICMNSPRGRAAIEAIRKGEWRGSESSTGPDEVIPERPNIFQLYEANIGPLTPLLADALRDAEKSYPADWIEEAFRIGVERNKRNWHYIEAILRHWQEGGRDDRKDQQNRRDSEEARRRYKQWEQ